MPGLPPGSPAVEAAYRRFIPLAQQAGFSGDSLVTIMAIAFAESGLDPAAQHRVSDPGKPDDGSIDRGLLQYNSYWQSSVTDACAYDVACSFRMAWTVSKQGKDFRQWNAYKNNVNAYQTGVNDLKAILSGQPIPNPDLTAGTQTASTGTGNLPGVLGSILGDPFASLLSSLKSWGLHIGLFMLALLLVIVGFWIIAGPPPTGDIQKMLKS